MAQLPMILKVKDVAIFAAKFSDFFFLNLFAKSVFHMRRSKIIEIGMETVWLDREKTSKLKIKYKWGP